MSSKSRRRITIAAGAAIAGAAIPLAAAANAWADNGLEITYDGTVIYDSFDPSKTFGTSDVGTLAQSGTNNDWAIVSGPSSLDTATNTSTGLANDSAASDVGDVAYWSGSTVTPFDGAQGADITNATNSDAVVTGGGNAFVNAFSPQYGATPGLVTTSSAIASNGGTALVGNDGLTSGLTTMSNDYAIANGTATLGSHTDTPTVAEILDSNASESIANDTGFNPATFEGGSAVDIANNSFAYATGAGSASNIEGGVLNGVPLNGGPAITNDSNVVNDGLVNLIDTSNTYQFDGIPDTTFFGDLLGLGGSTAFSTAWADLAALF